jgi:hypothetical protein
MTAAQMTMRGRRCLLVAVAMILKKRQRKASKQLELRATTASVRGAKDGQKVKKSELRRGLGLPGKRGQKQDWLALGARV